MCNPRRVTIQLNRCIESAWRQTVEQVQSVSGSVSELARINTRVPLDEEMGDSALAMLERVLSGEFKEFEPWDRDQQGVFHRNLGDLTMMYDPATHQLSVETQLTETVTAEARAAVEASGFTVGEVAVEAVGTYFDDNWGGRDEGVALEEAQKSADHKLSKAIEELHLQQHASELEAARDQARTQAQILAEQQLAERQAATREALRDRLRVTLAQGAERASHIMNQAVGEAYRQTLISLVRQNGGRILTNEQTGSVINVELELY
ncbi:MAG TPA: hypothetical protein VFX97_05545 [Pyrinomonadaceae bacterium]|nr:hypothetical protein [Pyrinomonadaceae bacterium]